MPSSGIQRLFARGFPEIVGYSIPSEISTSLQVVPDHSMIIETHMMEASDNFRVACENNSVITKENQHFKLCKAVAPLWLFPYEKQLDWKYQMNKHQLKNLSRKLQGQVLQKILNRNGAVCDLEQVRRSPVITCYRNKDQFCVGKGVDGFPKTVGFPISARISWRKSALVYVTPDGSPVTKPTHAALSKVYQKYITNRPWDVCSKIFRDVKNPYRDGWTGNFREFRIRSNIFGEHMVSIIFHPQNLDKHELDEEKRRIREFFVRETELLGLNLTSLSFQPCRYWNCSSEDVPFEVLHGTDHIEERLLNFRFKISPSAFFQSNTPGAEVLLNTIAEVCKLDEDTVLLDICSGTGIYSIALSSRVQRSFGVDVNPAAVRDAKLNAMINRVENVEFLQGLAENIVPDLLDTLAEANSKVVAIVNPSRYGLMGSLVTALRNFKKLKRLVYISCNPFGKSVWNLFSLCRQPNEVYANVPFNIVRAVPVDMFPQTVHCELIFLLER